MKVIVCTGANAGRAVIYGDVSKKPTPGEMVEVKNARMILRWDKLGLFGLAAKGPVGDTRITHAVKKTGALKCHEWLTVSEEAAKAIDSWEDYEG